MLLPQANHSSPRNADATNRADERSPIALICGLSRVFYQLAVLSGTKPAEFAPKANRWAANLLKLPNAVYGCPRFHAPACLYCSIAAFKVLADAIFHSEAD